MKVNLYILMGLLISLQAPAQMIRTIAGTGIASFTGEGGPASVAGIYCPQAAVFDTAGNLFFVDRGNRRIRKIDASGIITTVKEQAGVTNSDMIMDINVPDGLYIINVITSDGDYKAKVVITK
jgi:hypothetical protein